MNMPAMGWRNKRGADERDGFTCGTWAKYWLGLSGKAWPDVCSVAGCSQPPSLGAQIVHMRVAGEKIVPMCDSCNKSAGEFDLRTGIILVAANKAKTCG